MKICVECRHYHYVEAEDMYPPQDQCRCPKLKETDYIYGSRNIYPLKMAREDPSLCSIQAIWWEPKDAR